MSCGDSDCVNRSDVCDNDCVDCGSIVGNSCVCCVGVSCVVGDNDCVNCNGCGDNDCVDWKSVGDNDCVWYRSSVIEVCVSCMSLVVSSVFLLSVSVGYSIDDEDCVGNCGLVGVGTNERFGLVMDFGLDGVVFEGVGAIDGTGKEGVRKPSSVRRSLLR